MFNYNARNFITLAPGFAGSALLRNILTLTSNSADVFFKNSSLERKLDLINNRKEFDNMHIGEFDQIGFDQWGNRIDRADYSEVYVHHGHIQRLCHDVCQRHLSKMSNIQSIVVVVGSQACRDLINHRRHSRRFTDQEETEEFFYNQSHRYIHSFYNIQSTYTIPFADIADPDRFANYHVNELNMLLGFDIDAKIAYNIVSHWRENNFKEVQHG
jgi:hypothetical protein